MAPTTKRDAATTVPQNFSAQELKQILDLARKSKSIELKLSVPLTGHRATIAAIGLDPVEAQPRQVFFFDTADLALNRAGLIVRARRFPGGRADTVIKRRPVDPATIDGDLKRSDSFKVELDVMPGGFVCSASCKGVATGREVLDVSAGKMPLRSLFSKEQRAFYDANAPAGIELNSLLTLGPTFLLRAKHQPKDFERGITVEMWLYPDGSRILEISTKCLPSEAFQAAAEFKGYLADRGLPVGPSQETKTKAAMEFFRAGLEPGPVSKPASDQQAAGKQAASKPARKSAKAARGRFVETALSPNRRRQRKRPLRELA